MVHTTVGTGQCQRAICLFCLRHTSGLGEIPPLPLRSEFDAVDFLCNMASVAGMAAGCEDAVTFQRFTLGQGRGAPEVPVLS